MTIRTRLIGMVLFCFWSAWWAQAALCETPNRNDNIPVYFGFALEGYPIEEGQVRSVICETGLSPHILLFYLQWKQPKASEPQLRSCLEAIWAMGAVPCMTWEPMRIVNGKEEAIDYRNILEGDYDAYLGNVAATIQAFGQPVLIRFAHEMNLKRYHWGTDEAGYGPQSPEIYRRLFRYVVTFFKKAGVSHVRWVFCPNAESLPNAQTDPKAGWNEIAAYYPGDEWVDVLGVDGYNWGTTQNIEKHGWRSTWRSFEDIFDDPVRRLRALSPKKPLIVFETASADSGGDKDGWIREAFQTTKRWGMEGVVWFQVNKEIDWRLQSGISAQTLSWLRSEMSCSQRWAERLPSVTSK